MKNIKGEGEQVSAPVNASSMPMSNKKRGRLIVEEEEAPNPFSLRKAKPKGDKGSGFIFNPKDLKFGKDKDKDQKDHKDEL